ncbi:MAG: hypothetical protein ACHQF2_06845, partial [Flavobacteriales bacterium]
MRNELEHLARIEKYLMNRMNEGEKKEFQQEMKNDTSITSEVNEVKLMMEGATYTSWKNQVVKGYSSYRTVKRMKYIAVAIAATAFVAWGVLFLKGQDLFGSYENQKSPTYLPELNEQGENLWADADKFLPSQYFQIDPSKDTVVVSENGIVLAIPAGFAQNNDGSDVSGKVEITLKEALDPASIMMAGLSTRSGDKQLETGGMFYLNVT